MKLEEAITQAQNIERQVIEMTHWMMEISSLLQSRLDADMLAGDMPEEYEVTWFALCRMNTQDH